MIAGLKDIFHETWDREVIREVTGGNLIVYILYIVELYKCS